MLPPDICATPPLPSASRQGEASGRADLRVDDLLQGQWTDAALQRHLRATLAGRILVQSDPVEGSRAQADAIVAGRYQFIGETHRWQGIPNWLENPSRDVEWHILLHKFYYAVGLGEAWRDTGERRYLDTWIALAGSWMDQVPPGFIAADVTGRRLQNWIQAYSFFAGALPSGFNRRFLHSVHEQVQWLRANLHPARNHRTLELYAILLAGVAFPEFRASSEWTALAVTAIAENMRHDLRPDGVHCEQSTDYHHLVLRNYLNARRLCALNDIVVPPDMDAFLERALEFSLHAHRPDGRVPALSDGDVNDYRELLMQGYQLFGRRDMLYVATGGARGEPPANRCRWFPDGGYAFLRSGWGMAACPQRGTDAAGAPGPGTPVDGAPGTSRFEHERYLVFDCGPLGAGNHGHLDLLSFEAYGYGHPLVVDPGRYTYHEDPNDNWRVRFRGTGYHNTVRVDGRDQTRYRQGPSRFKISGPAPEHHLECFQTGAELDYVCGTARSHEYDAVHERRIAFVRGRYWVIVDTMHAQEPHRYELLFHLSAMAWRRTAFTERDGVLRCVSPHLLIAHLPDGDVAYDLEEGYVSQRYGEKSPAPIVRFARNGMCARFITVVYPYELEAPGLKISTSEEVRVTTCEGGMRTTDRLVLTRHDASMNSHREEARNG